jgi:hypothetical protein
MSKVHLRFNLLLCSGCSIGSTRGLGWDTSVVRCLGMRSWKTVRTNGICRSVWNIWFVTYQSALVMFRRIFDWYLCIIAIFDLQAQPHRTMPYAWLLKARILLLPPVVPASYDDDYVCVCVCVRTTWNDDRNDRTAELHSPSIRQQTAWSGIFLDELIRDRLAQ